MIEKIKNLYEDVERSWSWSYVASGLAGYVCGAMQRFDDWGRIFNSLNFRETGTLPWFHLEFQWRWVAITIQVAAGMAAAMMARKQVTSETRPGVFMGTNIAVALASALLVAGAAGSGMGLAFGLAGISSFAIGGQALKAKLTHAVEET